jgi:hypothetical protein
LSRCGLVFVQQAAEKVAAPELQPMKGCYRARIGSAAVIGCSQVACSVGTLLVEVADVDEQEVFELAATKDQERVEAFPAHAADPALCIGVRIRRLDRRSHDFDPSLPKISSKARLNFLSRS